MAKAKTNGSVSYSRYPSNNGKNNKNGKKSNNWIYILLGVALIVAIVLIVVFTTGGGANGKQNANGDLVIPVSEISKNIKIYTVKVDGVRMQILVAYTSTGQLRTALNTCAVCFDSGRGYYKVSGNVAECQNCHYKYTVDEFDTVQGGGCKPVAISAAQRTLTADTLTIPVSTLRANKSWFK